MFNIDTDCNSLTQKLYSSSVAFFFLFLLPEDHFEKVLQYFVPLLNSFAAFGDFLTNLFYRPKISFT